MEVERDLPLVLELLATLAESGLGFDAAIARIIDAQPATSPLTVELRNFQRETLTGRPRVESLRRLAKRLDVQSLRLKWFWFVLPMPQICQRPMRSCAR